VVCAAVNAFEHGTEDVIVALEQVAAEATKPLVGVFLDFHLPMLSGGKPDTSGSLPRFDGSVDAIQALSSLTAYTRWCDRDAGGVPMLEAIPVRPSC
jgi:hypothetical protein